MRATLLPSTVLVVLAMSCARGERYIRTEERLVDAAGERVIGRSCTVVGDRSETTTGGGRAGGGSAVAAYSLRLVGTDDGVTILVSGGGAVVERDYGEDWLRGDNPPDVIDVRLDPTVTYRVTVSGGAACGVIADAK